MITSATAGVHMMPFERLFNAYLAEAKYEFMRTIRTIAFAAPFLIMPIAVYLLFGVVMAGDAIAKNPNLANLVFAGFCVFAVIGPGIFGVGCSLAMERDAGLMKLRRALPAPVGSTIIAKMLAAMLFATLAVTPLVIAGVTLGRLTLSGGQLAALVAVAVTGSIPFSAIGLFLGAYTSGSASPAVANLLFLPMMWLSGMFIPLPKFLQTQTVFWPSFHLEQLGLHAAGITEFAKFPVAMSIACLVGVTVLFGGLAIVRLARPES